MTGSDLLDAGNADRSVDVVVIGFGAAGLASAIAARDAGAEVLILEKMPEAEAGGSSRVSGLLWYTPTSAPGAAKYLRNLSGEYSLPEELITAWADEMTGNTAWVESLGIEVGIRPDNPEFPEVDGHESDRGWYYAMPGMGDSHLWLRLRDAAQARGIEVLYGARARELAQKGTAREVTGVIVDMQDGALLRIEARRGVVLASGGFANNPQLARDYLRLPGIHPRGSPASTGDGLKMAQKAGAGLWHMHNFVGAEGIKVPEFATSIDITMPAEGWIYVDRDGRRFMDESIPWRHGKVRSGDGFKIFPDRIHHCVFDEDTRLAGPLHRQMERSRTSWNRLVDGYEWSSDNSAEVARGWISQADSLAGLAQKINVDPTALQQSVDSYNAACEAGSDSQFRRDPSTLTPIVRAPFYAWTWGPIVTYTCGGPMKDGHARVLSPDGSPIPRLYAAGEVSSTYSWAQSGGLMIGDALAFGRIAGRNAAAEAPR